MSYKIEYEGRTFNEYKQFKAKRIDRKSIAILMSLLIVLFISVVAPVRSAVLDYILPGDGPVTRKAANTLFQNLKNGEDFKEAFSDFCIEIFENA